MSSPPDSKRPDDPRRELIRMENSHIQTLKIEQNVIIMYNTHNTYRDTHFRRCPHQETPTDPASGIPLTPESPRQAQYQHNNPASPEAPINPGPPGGGPTGRTAAPRVTINLPTRKASSAPPPPKIHIHQSPRSASPPPYESQSKTKAELLSALPIMPKPGGTTPMESITLEMMAGLTYTDILHHYAPQFIENARSILQSK